MKIFYFNAVVPVKMNSLNRMILQNIENERYIEGVVLVSDELGQLKCEVSIIMYKLWVSLW